jgi:hypothetical protein
MMKVNNKVMVTTVPPDRPLAYTRRPIFVSAGVHSVFLLHVLLALRFYDFEARVDIILYLSADMCEPVCAAMSI